MASLLHKSVVQAQSPGEQVEITFFTYPPAAQVFRERPGESSDQYLGLAGEPVKVPAEDASYLFLLDEDHAIATVHISYGEIKNDRRRYPVGGVIRLQPNSAWVGLRDLFRYQRTLAMALTGALLLALPSGVWLALRTRRRLQRARFLEKLHTQPASEDDQPKLVGHALGRFRLVECIGAGGMGSVYRAVPDDTLNTSEPVAIKVLRHQDSDLQERFRREVLVCRELQHPNIVRLYDWGEYRPDDSAGLLYLVMEYLEGGTLGEHLRPGEPLSPRKAWTYLEPVFRGLEFAHKRGVVHRDLTPANIFVTDRGLVKLMDFGLAKAAHYPTVTVTGMAMGTPAYMPPEQACSAKAASPRSDQYALGVVAYELLAGKRPYADEALEPVQVLLLHLNEDARPLREDRPDLAEAVELVLARMMRRDPEQRYPSLGQARCALEQALSENPVD